METPPPAPDAPTPAPAAVPHQSPQAVVARIKGWRQAHPVAESALFFAAGFLFDLATLSRIDDGATMLQLGSYLLILGTLLIMGEVYGVRALPAPRLLQRALPYVDDAVHFLLGSVLSSFALFYFKSAAGLSGALFSVVLFGLLVGNELPRFRQLGPVMRFAVYSFCVTSFLAYVLPVLAGFLSVVLFLAAVALSLGVTAAMHRLLMRWQPDALRLKRLVVYPAAAVQVVLVSLYLLRVVPPVPLSIQEMGIYHNVERRGGEVFLDQLPSWKFWQKGDQTFLARPGDKVWVFAQIFAPRHFRDRINIRWVYDHPKMGWTSSDVIPLTVTGGREQGFRGSAYKSNWRVGDWRVEVETEDGRTIGYITFTVEEDPSTEPRTFDTKVR